jgi:hypothetical protein
MEQLTSPDLYNIYDKVTLDSTGNYLLDRQVLHLPDKAGFLVVNHLPSTGQLLLDGSLVIANETEIAIQDIEAGLLVWSVGTPDLDILLDTNYFVFDTDGALISLLRVYYPLDIVQDVVDNIINGGNFLTGEDGEGVNTDAGDFDIGEMVNIGYSFDGGDFDTGERVGVAPPPISLGDYYMDGELDPESQSIITLLDENLEPVLTSELPNTRYFSQSVVDVDMVIDVNYTIECEIVYVSKYFEGFNYGAIVPDYGYDIDYGSIDTENSEGYDFNSIDDYVEPTPANSVS